MHEGIDREERHSRSGLKVEDIITSIEIFFTTEKSMADTLDDLAEEQPTALVIGSTSGSGGSGLIIASEEVFEITGEKTISPLPNVMSDKNVTYSLAMRSSSNSRA